MAFKVRLDSAGMLEMLSSKETAAAVHDAAEVVAAGAKHTTRRGVEIPVEVSDYTTDRAASAVTLARAAGLGVEALHGTLGKAASAAGLQMKRRKS